MPGRIDVGRTQISTQQMIAGKDIQGEEAILVVKAVEEAADLIAVNRIIGGVEVKNQFLGRRRLRSDEDLDQDAGDVEEGAAPHAVLQPAESRRRGQRLLRIDAAFGDELHERIIAQALMIVTIFVTQSDGEDALAEHRALLVGDKPGITGIGNHGVQLLDQTDLAVDLAQQQRPGIGGDCSAGKIGHDLTTGETGKDDRFAVTVCHATALPPCVFGCLITPERTGSKAVAL